MQARGRGGVSLQNSWIDESHGEKDKVCGLDEQVLSHRGTFDKNTVTSLVSNHPWSTTK